MNSKAGDHTVRGPKPGTTLYALTNEFLSRRYSFEDLLAQTAARGTGPGLEIVGFQSIRGFPVVTDEFADRFKELVARHKLVPTSLAINADQEIRRGRVMSDDEMVAYHEPQIRAAAKLGFPVARYQYGAGPDVIRRLTPLAEKLNVKLGLEIHAPQHANHPDVLQYREMYSKVRSPYLGWIPDFSSTAKTVPPSFLEFFRAKGVPESLISLAMQIWHGDGDAQTRMMQYKQRARASGADELHLNELSLIFPMFGKQDPRSWLELMPEVVHIHGKFFGFDAAGNEEAIDYPALLPLFRDGGFNGYMSSEWEGHMYSDADAFEMIQKHQAMCRRILAMN
jgi:sugar phosphate isomerase/epimerase